MGCTSSSSSVTTENDPVDLDALDYQKRPASYGMPSQTPSSRTLSSKHSSNRSLKSTKSIKSFGKVDLFDLNISDYCNYVFIYQGQFGKVFSGEQDNKDYKVALKCFGYTQSRPDEDSIKRELSFLLNLKGVDGIVQLQGVINDPPAGVMPGKIHPFEYPIIVTELLEGGDLSSRVTRDGGLSEKKISNLFLQIVLALEGLHMRGIIHRDLKMENLIFASDDTDSPIKIVDLGSAVKIPSASPDGIYEDNGLVGTLGYVAPESIQYFNYSCASDFWQAGCVLYTMLSGLRPFDPLDIDQITHRQFFPMEGVGWDNISASAKNLVKRLLCRNPKYRITIGQILDHPWITHNKDLSDESFGVDFLTRFRFLVLKEQLDEIASKLGPVCDIARPIAMLPRCASGVGSSDGTNPRTIVSRRSSEASASSQVHRWLMRRQSSCDTGFSPEGFDGDEDDDHHSVKSYHSDLGVLRTTDGPDELNPEQIHYTSYYEIMMGSSVCTQLSTLEAFQLLDQSKKGYLEMQDFLLALLAIRNVKERDLINGVIDSHGKSVFLSQQAASSRTIAFEQSMERHFRTGDIEQSGHINIRDIKVAIGLLFLDLSNPIRSSSLYVQSTSRVVNLLRNIVVSKDGMVEYNDFKHLYMSLLDMYQNIEDDIELVDKLGNVVETEEKEDQQDNDLTKKKLLP